jgi:hypothetical protein
VAEVTDVRVAVGIGGVVALLTAAFGWPALRGNRDPALEEPCGRLVTLDDDATLEEILPGTEPQSPPSAVRPATQPA